MNRAGGEGHDRPCPAHEGVAEKHCACRMAARNRLGMKTGFSGFSYPILCLILGGGAGFAHAGDAAGVLDRCLADSDRVTVSAMAGPAEDIPAQLPVLAGRDSGCIGTALSACTIRPFTSRACLDDLSRLLGSRLDSTTARHPDGDDRPEALRAAHDHWRTSAPDPCTVGDKAVCTALGLGGRLIEARGWQRRFDLEAVK